MKKIIFSLIISMMFITSAYAEYDITVKINGKEVETPISPVLINDRTMLPMRAIFENLGAKVTWAKEDQMIFATKGDAFITLKIGEPKMSVQKVDTNEYSAVSLDVSPYIENDYTLVPVRAVAEALDAEVEWIQESRTVEIITE